MLGLRRRASTPHEYRFHAGRIFAVAAGSILLLDAVVAVTDIATRNGDRFGLAALGPIMSGFGLGLVWFSLWLRRLVVMPEGLAFKSLGPVAFAPWVSLGPVTRVRRYRLFYKDVDVLRLLRPLQGQGGKLSWALGLRCVPLSLYARDWRTSGLGEDLARWAPRLVRD